jgi:hypothetical protein
MSFDGIKHKSVSTFADTTIVSGRARFLGIQVQVIGTEATYDRDSTISDNLITLRNSSSTGDVLFQCCKPGAASGDYLSLRPMTIMLGNRSILFDEGIYLTGLGGSGADDLSDSDVSLVVFYA